MISRRDLRKSGGRRFVVAVSVVLFVCAALIVYAKSARNAAGPFGLADDLPRGAIVYAQFADLPALVERWESSSLKRQYLDSTNFKQFQKRHLALKLVERWEEFNNALGFTLDAGALTGATEASAAVAVYDIGRLDLVFVAPLSDERAALSRFIQSRDQFEETELPDGTLVYSRDVEADRGRQKQKILFATTRGRFVLATSEPLLLRALANVAGRSKQDRLSDDASFKTLSREVRPHFVTVWVDQSKLNDDWYFKHYWAMSSKEQLRGIRAGMFDLEMLEGRWVERRNFLLTGKESPKKRAITSREARRLAGMIPADVPYLKVISLDEDSEAAAQMVRGAVLDRLTFEEHKGEARSWSRSSYNDSDFEVDRAEDGWWGGSRYASLGYEYDSSVNDPDDAGERDADEADESRLRVEVESQAVAKLARALATAQPHFAAAAESPQALSGTLFAEFRRALILNLRRPAALDRQAVEQSLAELVGSRLTVAGASANLKWTSKVGDSEAWRELELPMLGWKICYALKDGELIVTNSAELLAAIMDGSAARQKQPPPKDFRPDTPLEDLTIIRTNRREEVFDRIVENLDAQRIKAYRKARRSDSAGEEDHSDGASQEFFSGNISSLLDVGSAVSQIEIKRSFSPNRLREEVEIGFHPTPKPNH